MKETLSILSGHDGAVWNFISTGRAHRMHHHDELEVNLSLRGSAVYLLKDRRYELRPGMLIWLFPDHDHVLVEQSPDYSMWIAIFRPSLLRRVCQTAAYRILLQANPDVELCRRLSAPASRRLDGLFNDVAQSELSRDAAKLNAGLAYLALSAWSAHESSEAIIGRDVHPAVERAALLIRDESVPTKLSVLADRAGLSPSRLSYLFKHQTGVSLVRFRQMQQLDRFLREYQSPSKPTMLEASLSAGFGSYAQFHRVFKTLMGFGPAKYRNRERE